MNQKYAINSPPVMRYDSTLLFSGNRFFSGRDIETGEMVGSFDSREGEIGPYHSKELAEAGLLRHIERCKRGNLDGGRAFELTRAHQSTDSKSEERCSAATNKPIA